MEANLITMNYIHASNHYHQDHLKWCLSKKPIPPEINFLYICPDWYVVISLVISLTLFHIMAYFADVFEYPRHDWNTFFLVGVAGCCGFPCKFSPKSIPFRVIFMVFVIGTFFIASIIVAISLNWMLETNYYPQFNSFEQVIDAEYILSGDSFALAKLSTTKDIINPLTLNGRFSLCKSAEICLDQLHAYQDMAVAISYEYFRSISKEFKTDIYCISVSGFSTRHSLNFLLGNNFKFKAELNRFIQMANEGGLIFKWISNFSSEHGTKYEHTIHGAKYEISMKHLMISLSLPCLFLLLSLLVFPAEIVIHKLKTRAEFRKFFAFAELIIDPERHFLNYDLRYVLPISYAEEDLE